MSISRGASAFQRPVPPTPARTPNNKELLEQKLLLSSSSKKAAKKTSPRTPLPLSASQSQRKRYRQGGTEAATSPIRVNFNSGGSSGGSRIGSQPLLRRDVSGGAVNDDNDDDEDFYFEGDSDLDDDEIDEGLPENRIPVLDPRSRRLLGRGNSSEVYEVRCTDNNRLYALKEDTETLTSEGNRDSRLKKLRRWDNLRHERIVRFLRAWQDEAHLRTLMQLCEDGSLDQFVEDHISFRGGLIDPTLLLAAFRDTCLALDYLHSQRVAHLDVKPANICLSNGRALLCDLELVTEFDGAYPTSDHRYASREAAFGPSNVHPSADIFSLGISFFQLITQKELPKGGEEWTALRERPPTLQDFPVLGRYPDLARLISLCMHRQPEARPSAQDLLADPAVSGVPRHVRLIPPPEARRIVVDNRPASASLFVSSPRESSLGMAGPFSFQAVVTTSPIGPSPPLSRTASRTASPHSRLERRLFASPSPQMHLESQAGMEDSLSHQLESKAVVTPRPSGGMTPLMFQPSNRPTSPRPSFGTGSPLVFHTAAQ